MKLAHSFANATFGTAFVKSVQRMSLIGQLSKEMRYETSPYLQTCPALTLEPIPIGFMSKLAPKCVSLHLKPRP